MTKIALMILSAFMGSMQSTPRVASGDETLQNPLLKETYRQFGSLFKKYYPEATSHLLKDQMHFEHDTRIFLVHEPLMTGEWQDPFEMRGPKPGGILCTISLQKGKYAGQAVAPQIFDIRYFKVKLMAPYSEKKDVHLLIHLSYPANVPPDFLKAFTELANDFEKYLPL